MHPCTPAVSAAAAFLLGCGDAAVGSSFQGEPVDQVACSVYFGTSAPVISSLHPVTFFGWIGDDLGHTFVPQPATGVHISATFPGTASVELLDPPPAGAERAWDGITGTLALGQVVVIDDIDGDGAWTPKVDHIIGVSADLVVAFTSQGASGVAVGALSPGFHHLTPNPCPASARLGVESATCSVGIDKDLVDLFPLSCRPEYPCTDIIGIRWFCRLHPESATCSAADCGPCVFPAGATPSQCDAWRVRCDEVCPPDECADEWQICADGEPPCDEACLCQHVYDDCLKWSDTETCQVKFGGCLPGGGG